MVKLPVGTRVVVDLWDPDKKRGIVKHYGDTMDLVQAESEFPVKVGDPALVIKSHEGYVLIIPMDNEYTKLIASDGKTIDLVGLTRLIHELLVKTENSTGGILSEADLLLNFDHTPLKYLINEDYLKKLGKMKQNSVDLIKQGKTTFYALHPAEIITDKQTLLQYSKNQPYITTDKVQAEHGWSDFRIQRILDYLVASGRCRKDTSYRSGVRYYFNQLQ